MAVEADPRSADSVALHANIGGWLVSPLFYLVSFLPSPVLNRNLFMSLILALTLNVRAVPDILHTVLLFRFMAVAPCMHGLQYMYGLRRAVASCIDL